jgi:hypothetical protein
MYVLLYLHILTMFTAVTLAGGTSIFMLIADWRADRALAAALTGLPLDRIIPPFYLIGGLFGLLTAVSFGYGLLAPWLLIAYALFAALMALGILYSGPLLNRVRAAATDESVDLGAFAGVMRLGRVDSVISLTGIALIIADMVFKPFS